MYEPELPILLRLALSNCSPDENDSIKAFLLQTLEEIRKKK
jgi:hypothetical protein